jgi:hypothetical protein
MEVLWNVYLAFGLMVVITNEPFGTKMDHKHTYKFCMKMMIGHNIEVTSDSSNRENQYLSNELFQIFQNNSDSKSNCVVDNRNDNKI